MTLPRSTEISRKIEERLQGILTTNGFYTDLGQRIFRGRAALHQDVAARPYASLISARDTADPESRRRSMLSREYDLIVTLNAGAEYDEQQDRLLYDLRRALSKTSQASILDGLALSMQVGPAQLDDPDLGSNTAQITLTVTVTYAEMYD